MIRRSVYWVLILLPIFAFHRLIKRAFFIGFFMEKDNFIAIYQFFGKELKLKGFDKEVFAYIYDLTKEDGIVVKTELKLNTIKSYFENDKEVEESISRLIEKGLVKKREWKSLFDKSFIEIYVIDRIKINEIRKQYQSNL